MVIREIKDNELSELLALYTHLHELGIPDNSDQLQNTWAAIMGDKNHHIIVCEVDGKLVSSCVCVIIPNLTRNIRPYAFIENVITDEAYRNRGLASACLSYAKELAMKENCYKMMYLKNLHM